MQQPRALRFVPLGLPAPLSSEYTLLKFTRIYRARVAGEILSKDVIEYAELVPAETDTARDSFRTYTTLHKNTLQPVRVWSGGLWRPFSPCQLGL